MAKPKTPRKKTSVKPPLPQAIQTEGYIPSIVRVLTENPLKNNDVEVVVPSPIRNGPMRESMTAPFRSPPKSDLGTMRVLPLELLHMICLSLDFRSCFTLRHVNRQARAIVSGLPQYHALAAHALECLKIVFRSRAARKVTVDDLYRIFYRPECMMCSTGVSSSSSSQASPLSGNSGVNGVHSAGVTSARGSDTKKPSGSLPSQSGKTKKASKETASDAEAASDLPQLISATATKTDGMFLFLPTMTRCCRACLEESPRARAVPLSSLILASNLTPKDFDSVRIAAPLLRPNAKKMSEVQEKVSKGTVSQRDAIQVLLDKGNPPERVKEILFHCGYIHEFSWPEELYERAAFATIMPFLDRRAQQAYRGFVCRGCEQAAAKKYGNLKAQLHYFKPVYGTQACFLDHVSTCPEAIKLWASTTIDAVSPT